MLVHPRVASFPFAAATDLLNCAQQQSRASKNPRCNFVISSPAARRFSRTWRMLWGRSRSRNRRVEDLGGVGRRFELRSCIALPTSAEVEESDLDGHDSALLSSEFEAGEDGEWRSLGRDGRVESLSTSSRSNPVVVENLGTNRIGTRLQTVRNIGRPLGREGTAAEGQERNVDGLNGYGYGFNSSQDINKTEDKDEPSAQGDLTEDLPGRQRVKKRGFLDVRKPSNARASRTSQVYPVKELEAPPSQAEVEYYVPKVGDEVIGVVVSGNEYKLDIDIGSEHLGRTLSKDVNPLDRFRSDEVIWEMDDDDASLPVTPLSQVRYVGDGEASNSSSPLMLPLGSVLSLQVFGVTSSGRPLLSVRKIASRIAWQRVRQIHEQDEPFEAQCVEWNSDGLVFNIEGLRAILRLEQFVNRAKDSKSLKDHVGKWKNVVIIDVDEAAGRLLLSEKRAWVRVGSLVVGTVQRIFPFGVEVTITGTSLRGMVHISCISHFPVSDILSVFSPGEKVKAVVIKSAIPYRIALSTALLESSEGLILQDKERVFREAEEMAAIYRGSISEDENKECEDKISSHTEVEDPPIANLDWLDFGEERGISLLGTLEDEQ